MKKQVITNLTKSRNIVIPIYIYKIFPKLKIDLNVFIFLMYLYNIDEKIIFNPQKISEELGIKVSDILFYIQKLSERNLVDFEITKNEKNISEEYLSLTGFYERLSTLLIEDEDNDKESGSQIYQEIEKEFGRVLSSIEIEIIKAWQDNDFSDELIREALKETVFNGVNNLRYMDKILYEWQKKGFKTKHDVEQNRKNYKNNKEKVDVFEYNWLEDEE